MRFEVEGKLSGRLVRVVWQDGDLSGDEAAVRAIRILAGWREGFPVGPVMGPYSYKDHLKSAIAAAMIIQGVLKGARVVGGEWPSRDLSDLPDGAVI